MSMGGCVFGGFVHAPYFTSYARENMIGVEIVVMKYEEKRGEGGWGRVRGVLLPMFIFLRWCCFAFLGKTS